MTLAPARAGQSCEKAAAPSARRRKAPVTNVTTKRAGSAPPPQPVPPRPKDLNSVFYGDKAIHFLGRVRHIH